MSINESTYYNDRTDDSFQSTSFDILRISQPNGEHYVEVTFEEIDESSNTAGDFLNSVGESSDGLQDDNETLDQEIPSDPPESPEVIGTGEEIIDEINDPIQSSEKKKFFLFFFAFVICVAIFIGLVKVSMGSTEKWDDSHNQDQMMVPSPSPTVSMAPTSFFSEYLKQLLIPISGEDVLMDKASIQNFLWWDIVHKVDTLNEKEIVDLNDEEDLIQRFVVGVTLMSLFDNKIVIKSIVERNVLPHICELHICNEKNKVIVLETKSGRVPGAGGGILVSEVGELKSLTHIIFSQNSLHGSIPTEIGRLKHLEYLDLSDNLFTGRIPTEIGQLKNLKVLHLGSNLLNGTIPDEIGNLKNLSYLDFSSNFLNGHIPIEIGNLENLQVLSLQENNFSGNAEFLCDHNYSNGKYVEQIEMGNYTFNISGDYGVTADCDEMEYCSCCKCA